MSCLVLLFSFLLVSLMLTHIMIVFAQQEKQKGFLTWTDPQSKFSINYPFHWKVEEEGNRFGTYEITFADPTNSSHVSIYFDENNDNVGKEGSQDLKSWFEIFTLGFGSSVHGYKELGNIDYEKYKINGQQTGILQTNIMVME